MMHESIKVTEFTVKEDRANRLRIKMWKCAVPSTLNSLEFIQECFDKNGEVDFSSTYNFFMTDEEIATLCKGLLS
jgi:hypothetical protein